VSHSSSRGLEKKGKGTKQVEGKQKGLDTVYKNLLFFAYKVFVNSAEIILWLY
jgi:hypothetical protein